MIFYLPCCWVTAQSVSYGVVAIFETFEENVLINLPLSVFHISSINFHLFPQRLPLPRAVSFTKLNTLGITYRNMIDAMEW
jgi:hypothetical protein